MKLLFLLSQRTHHDVSLIPQDSLFLFLGDQQDLVKQEHVPQRFRSRNSERSFCAKLSESCQVFSLYRYQVSIVKKNN